MRQTNIVVVNIEGFGTGCKSGINIAKSILKNRLDGTVALCSFCNGNSMFIKSKGKVRPITDAEIKRINKERRTRRITRLSKVKR